MELLESKFTLKMGECIWESGFNSTEKTDCSLHIGLRGKFGKKEKLGKLKLTNTPSNITYKQKKTFFHFKYKKFQLILSHLMLLSLKYLSLN